MTSASEPGWPDPAAIVAAAARIEMHVAPTPVRRWPALEAACGATIHLKCEQHQPMGAFKIRGALNAVWSLGEAEAARGVVTHSSGNHGAALAWAARSRGIAAHVVMPRTSSPRKRANVEAFGGIVHVCEPNQAAREALAEELRAATGASFVHPYADPRVIAGQGTAVLELLEQCKPLDAILTPVGGGGLAAGCAIAAHAQDPAIRLFAAEPEGAADALASLRSGVQVREQVPETICDGLLTTLGEVNFRCLRAHGTEVLAVSDAECVAGMRALWLDLGEVIEPSSATVLAALRRYPERFAGLRVGVILTGGNVNVADWPWLAGD